MSKVVLSGGDHFERAGQRRRHRLEPSDPRGVVQDIRGLRWAGERAAGRPLLSHRQQEILRLIALGYGLKDIAGQLGVSRDTVTAHRAQILEQLSIRDTFSLVSYAIREGIIGFAAEA